MSWLSVALDLGDPGIEVLFSTSTGWSSRHSVGSWDVLLWTIVSVKLHAVSEEVRTMSATTTGDAECWYCHSPIVFRSDGTRVRVYHVPTGWHCLQSRNAN